MYPATGVLSLVTARGAWIAPSNRAVWVPGGFEHEHRAHGATDMRIIFLSPRLAELLPAHPAVLAVSALAREVMLRITEGAVRDTGALRRLRRVAIDELTDAPEAPLHLPVPQDDRLVALAAIVGSDLAAPVTLAELGRRVGASERTLSRLFQRETGMSFPQWRTQVRVHRALLLLADGLSVTDTATACGWTNPSAFIETFTALVGETPGRYQRQLQRQAFSGAESPDT